LRRRLPGGAALAARARRPGDAGVAGELALPAMCRLFALAAAEPVKAAFWLLEAPDSLAEQSRRNPDGYGLASFGPNGPEVEKEPEAAYADADFAREARERESRVFLAHVRYASVGAHTRRWSGPPSRWTRTPAGARSPPGSCCTSTARCA